MTKIPTTLTLSADVREAIERAAVSREPSLSWIVNQVLRGQLVEPQAAAPAQQEPNSNE